MDYPAYVIIVSVGLSTLTVSKQRQIFLKLGINIMPLKIIQFCNFLHLNILT